MSEEEDGSPGHQFSMSLDDAIFWIALTVFGAGLYFVIDAQTYGLILIAMGATGLTWATRYHVPKPYFRTAAAVIALLATWALIGYDIHVRHVVTAPGKTDTPSFSNDIPARKFVRTTLALNFSGGIQIPVEAERDNVRWWYSVYAPEIPIMITTSDKNGNLQTTQRVYPTFWTIFILFKEPTRYHQFVPTAPNGFPRTHVLEATDRWVVITTDNGDARGLLQLDAR